MTLSLADLCPGRVVCTTHDDYCPGNTDSAHCDECAGASCVCGLHWNPDRGPHTRTGIRLSPDVAARILAREGERREAEAIRAAASLADAEKRQRSPEAIALRTLAGLRFVRRQP